MEEGAKAALRSTLRNLLRSRVSVEEPAVLPKLRGSMSLSARVSGSAE
jgi:hypothetical protein